MKKQFFIMLVLMGMLFLFLVSCSFLDVAAPSNQPSISDEPTEEEVTVGIEGLEYLLSNDETMYAIKSIGSCNLSEITLPTEYNGKPVKVIANGAFALSSVEKIIIPEGYTNIYALAFQRCSSLKSVSLPETLISIGQNAFYACTALTEITIPQSVTALGSLAFEGCTSLATVNLGDNIENFNTNAFAGTPLMSTSANVIDGIQYIGNYIVSVDQEAVPENLTIKEGTVLIPSEAFKDCRVIKKVALPQSMKFIESKAFFGSSITEINLPDSVEYIGDSAFSNCLIDIYDVNGDCWYIGNHLIHCYTKSSNLSVRNGTITIASGAISTHGELTTLSLPKSLKYISDNNFLTTGAPLLQTILVDDENEYYKSVDGVLYNKAVTELVACPSGKSGTLTIPNTVTTINSNIFNMSSRLSTIILPKSVVQIDYEAFKGIGNSTVIYYCGSYEDYQQIIKSSNIWGESIIPNIYYYSDTDATDSGKRTWHYVDGSPVIWK